MIYAVTLNPCLDKTLTVPDWKPGDSVRGVATTVVVGGKGNNVARALKRLGRDVRPATFLGGANGAVCQNLLESQDGFVGKLASLIIPTASESRVILTVLTERTQSQTAFFDPDPAISPNEANRLLQEIEAAIDDSEIEGLTLSGSSPSETTHGLYSSLIASAKRRKVPVFVDTYGPALARIEPNWPTSIQMNRKEAGIFLGLPQPNEANCLGLLDRWGAQGLEFATITNGPDPGFTMIRGEKFRVLSPRIEPVNPIGSGDSMLAGSVDGWLSKLDAEGLIRRAFGSAIANAMVWDAGGIEPDEVVRWGNLVEIERIEV